MKKLLFAICIVLLLLSCNTDPMDNENNETEVVEKKDPVGITNVHHTRDGNNFTIYWDNPDDLYFITMSIWVKYNDNPVIIANDPPRFASDEVKQEYDVPLATEYSFAYSVVESAIIKKMQIHFTAWLNPYLYKQPSDPITDYWIDL